jgi:hypothetical protein
MAMRRRSIFPVGAAPPPLPSLPSLASSLAKAATPSAVDGAADVSKPEKDDAAPKVADDDDDEGEEEVRPTVVIGDKRDSGGRERSKRLSSPLSPPPPDGPLMRAKEKKIRKLTAKLAKKKMEGRGAHTTHNARHAHDTRRTTLTGGGVTTCMCRGYGGGRTGVGAGRDGAGVRRLPRAVHPHQTPTPLPQLRTSPPNAAHACIVACAAVAVR